MQLLSKSEIQSLSLDQILLLTPIQKAELSEEQISWFNQEQLSTFKLESEQIENNKLVSMSFWILPIFSLCLVGGLIGFIFKKIRTNFKSNNNLERNNANKSQELININNEEEILIMDNIELQSVCDENVENLNNEVDKWKQINAIDLSDYHSKLASANISGYSI
ncbi:MAG: hypothetical protein H9Q65_01750 [Spiroplasma ixodetis]|uniref:hypothetical protein n=1 Tax=Spiroplasma endosymbiont of Colias croceus TaxID=3066310 RepID=UPI0030D02875|nr:hypothetical protein [Spiroplasma ixodetis]MBP1527970.1 hypothetical protein [Spiroplasma ixodetis]